MKIIYIKNHFSNEELIEGEKILKIPNTIRDFGMGLTWQISNSVKRFLSHSEGVKIIPRGHITG